MYVFQIAFWMVQQIYGLARMIGHIRDINLEHIRLIIKQIQIDIDIISKTVNNKTELYCFVVDPVPWNNDTAFLSKMSICQKLISWSVASIGNAIPMESIIAVAWFKVSQNRNSFVIVHLRIVALLMALVRVPYSRHLTLSPLVPYICASQSGQHWFRLWRVADSVPCYYLHNADLLSIALLDRNIS